MKTNNYHSEGKATVTACVMGIMIVLIVMIFNLNTHAQDRSGKKNGKGFKFTSLFARAGNEAVHLKWTVKNEAGEGLYIIEKSEDGIFYRQTDTIKGLGKKGLALLYSYTDNEMLPGSSYYRIKFIAEKSKVSVSRSLRIDHQTITQAYWRRGEKPLYIITAVVKSVIPTINLSPDVASGILLPEK